LNAGDYEGASAQFLRWVNSCGKQIEGLVRRRMAEQAMFVRGEVVAELVAAAGVAQS